MKTILLIRTITLCHLFCSSSSIGDDLAAENVQHQYQHQKSVSLNLFSEETNYLQANSLIFSIPSITQQSNQLSSVVSLKLANSLITIMRGGLLFKKYQVVYPLIAPDSSSVDSRSSNEQSNAPDSAEKEVGADLNRLILRDLTNGDTGELFFISLSPPDSQNHAAYIHLTDITGQLIHSFYFSGAPLSEEAILQWDKNTSTIRMIAAEDRSNSEVPELLPEYHAVTSGGHSTKMDRVYDVVLIATASYFIVSYVLNHFLEFGPRTYPPKK